MCPGGYRYVTGMLSNYDGNVTGILSASEPELKAAGDYIIFLVGSIPRKGCYLIPDNIIIESELCLLIKVAEVPDFQRESFNMQMPESVPVILIPGLLKAW